MKPHYEIISEAHDIEHKIGLDHLDAAERILPFQPQFVNLEL